MAGPRALWSVVLTDASLEPRRAEKKGLRSVVPMADYSAGQLAVQTVVHLVVYLADYLARKSAG